MEKKNRVGIMGGTFNPIHVGHVITGECAYEQFALDKVLFMPSKTPPHKSTLGIASTTDRTNMVRLAIEENPHFTLSTIELEREGITYTVDTLLELHRTHSNCEYFFIIGADSLLGFARWRNPGEILKLATILVVSRYGLSDNRLLEQINKLKAVYGGHFEIVKMPTIDISSSEIRERHKKGLSIRYYVDHKVRQYMDEHSLYLEE